MSFLSSGSCESSHLKFWRNAFRSSALLFGFRFSISSSSLITLDIRLWIGVWVLGSQGLSGVENQKFWLLDGLSEVYGSSLMHIIVSSESSAVSTLIAAVLSGLCSFASSGDMILNSSTVVCFLIV